MLAAVIVLLLLLICLLFALAGLMNERDRLRRAARVLAQHQPDDEILAEAFEILQGRGHT